MSFGARNPSTGKYEFASNASSDWGFGIDTTVRPDKPRWYNPEPGYVRCPECKSWCPADSNGNLTRHGKLLMYPVKELYCKGVGKAPTAVAPYPKWFKVKGA